MNKKLLVSLILIQCVYSASPRDAETSIVFEEGFGSGALGRIGQYPYPNNPLYDRAKGYLLKGKVQSAVSNHGNFVTWDYHPGGFWGESVRYGYLPHLSFVAGVPGHEYSTQYIWEQHSIYEGLWFSTDAYVGWLKDVNGTVDPNNKWNYKTIVYNTVVDFGEAGVGHEDRGEIALEVRDYCDADICTDINYCDADICTDSTACKAEGNVWQYPKIENIDYEGGTQWLLDYEDERVYLYLSGGEDPNNVTHGIGLAFPWSIRAKLKSRTSIAGGFYFDLYDYGADLEEWTCDDDYVYYGATFAESWFFDDTPFGQPSIKSDWQSSTESRYNTHNLDFTAGDLFGNTDFTTFDDPDYLLAHSELPQTWPTRYNFDDGEYEPYWPGWWADEYYGDTPGLWAELGLSQCSGKRSDEGCWLPLEGRHISDMDIYMEFDDRWGHVGNIVENNEYVTTGYPMGLQVMSMAHSYGVAYAEDVMFVTVNVRNESGDGVAFERDKEGDPTPILDEFGAPQSFEGMIMPDGTKLNQGKGFDYKKLYLGFYMDADVLSTDITGGYSVHSNNDDFMQYIDCRISDKYYPNRCPLDPTSSEDTLLISMALIGDYDGDSGPLGYSMETDQNIGTDFGIVAVQLLDSPYSTDYVDMNQDGYMDIYPGQKLKMTDWHWFDWYSRPGVLSASGSSTPRKNKELIQYQVIAGDNTNLTSTEQTWYFHADDPNDELEQGLNSHLDSLEGLDSTSFFLDDADGLDCVLEMSTGPFELQVGEQVSFSFCVIFGKNIDDLLNNAYFAQIMYNSHYQGYTPPIPPQVMAIAKHNKIELYWDDLSIQSQDVITTYHDFEGYKIYRSIDGGVTWGSVDDEIIVSGDSQGWQPLSVGCVDNPYDEDAEGNCKNFSNRLLCESQDSNSDEIDDCFWKYAQFDLSANADSTFCIFGDEGDGTCSIKGDCELPCSRQADVQGPDPQAEWFNLGYDTGLEILMCDPENPNTNYVCDNYNNCCCVINEYYDDLGSLINVDLAPNCNGNDGTLILQGGINEYTTHSYKFVDEQVTDGMEYTYSIVAYDRGVPGEEVSYSPTVNSAGDTVYTQSVISIPDPMGWGNINPFQILESPKGTTIHDPNFVTIIPGYSPQNNLDHVRVVPNPYIVYSDFNETEYKKRIRFTRLPSICKVSIFTITGEKVRVLEHNNITDGNLWWDLRSYNNQEVAPGLYIYVVETPSGDKKIDKFAIVR